MQLPSGSSSENRVNASRHLGPHRCSTVRGCERLWPIPKILGATSDKRRHGAHALSFLGVEKRGDVVAHTRQQGGHIPRVVLTLGQRARDLGVGIVAHHKREVSTMEGDTSSVSLTREWGPHTGGSEAQSTTDSDAHTGGSKVMKKTPSFFPCVCVAAHRVHAKDDQRDQPLHGAPHAQKILIKCRILAEALGGIVSVCTDGGVARDEKNHFHALEITALCYLEAAHHTLLRVLA
jgi:hypothetical protein